MQYIKINITTELEGTESLKIHQLRHVLECQVDDLKELGHCATLF